MAYISEIFFTTFLQLLLLSSLTTSSFLEDIKKFTLRKYEASQDGSQPGIQSVGSTPNLKGEASSEQSKNILEQLGDISLESWKATKVENMKKIRLGETTEGPLKEERDLYKFYLENIAIISNRVDYGIKSALDTVREMENLCTGILKEFYEPILQLYKFANPKVLYSTRLVTGSSTNADPLVTRCKIQFKTNDGITFDIIKLNGPREGFFIGQFEMPSGEFLPLEYVQLTKSKISNLESDSIPQKPKLVLNSPHMQRNREVYQPKFAPKSQFDGSQRSQQRSLPSKSWLKAPQKSSQTNTWKNSVENVGKSSGKIWRQSPQGASQKNSPKNQSEKQLESPSGSSRRSSLDNPLETKLKNTLEIRRNSFPSELKSPKATPSQSPRGSESVNVRTPKSTANSPKSSISSKSDESTSSQRAEKSSGLDSIRPPKSPLKSPRKTLQERSLKSPQNSPKSNSENLGNLKSAANSPKSELGKSSSPKSTADSSDSSVSTKKD